jgi:hypothetical protein
MPRKAPVWDGDIENYFTVGQAGCMIEYSIPPLDLRDYDSVKNYINFSDEKKNTILAYLETGHMPKRGRKWGRRKFKRFKAWVDAGCPKQEMDSKKKGERHKPFVKVVSSIIFALALMFSNLSPLGRPGSIPSNQTLQADVLANRCKCDEGDHWNNLDLSIRPIAAPQLNPAIVPVDVRFKASPHCALQEPAIDCQSCFNCYAWQLFIALNWPAASIGEPDVNARFGHPDNFGPVVWETYKNVYDIFGDPKRELPPWGQADDRPKVLASNSAVILREELQVDHNWLTDQNGKIVRYETRINRDEYEYIRHNSLHYQEGIFKAYTDGDGIRLPDGTTQEFGKHGSIQVKAAWRIVPEGKLDEYKKRYKISFASVPGEGDNVAVALVGLHIAKKSRNAPQFAWATFEHKDNAPALCEANPERTRWSFYNPEKPLSYKPSWFAPPTESTDKKRPVQVKREIPLDKDSNQINEAVHALIAGPFSDSVWLNYILIGVQWPASPKHLPDLNHILPGGDPVPNELANITMETYLQEKNSDGFSMEGRSSCIDCHRASALTPVFDNKIEGWRTWWTDYSTIFNKAKARSPSK